MCRWQGGVEANGGQSHGRIDVGAACAEVVDGGIEFLDLANKLRGESGGRWGLASWARLGAASVTAIAGDEPSAFAVGAGLPAGLSHGSGGGGGRTLSRGVGASAATRGAAELAGAATGATIGATGVAAVGTERGLGSVAGVVGEAGEGDREEGLGELGGVGGVGGVGVPVGQAVAKAAAVGVEGGGELIEGTKAVLLLAATEGSEVVEGVDVEGVGSGGDAKAAERLACVSLFVFVFYVGVRLKGGGILSREQFPEGEIAVAGVA